MGVGSRDTKEQEVEADVLEVSWKTVLVEENRENDCGWREKGLQRRYLF